MNLCEKKGSILKFDFESATLFKIFYHVKDNINELVKELVNKNLLVPLN
jgi:hypothetical protein